MLSTSAASLRGMLSRSGSAASLLVRPVVYDDVITALTGGSSSSSSNSSAHYTNNSHSHSIAEHAYEYDTPAVPGRPSCHTYEYDTPVVPGRPSCHTYEDVYAAKLASGRAYGDFYGINAKGSNTNTINNNAVQATHAPLYSELRPSNPQQHPVTNGNNNLTHTYEYSDMVHALDQAVAKAERPPLLKTCSSQYLQPLVRHTANSTTTTTTSNSSCGLGCGRGCGCNSVSNSCEAVYADMGVGSVDVAAPPLHVDNAASAMAPPPPPRKATYADFQLTAALATTATSTANTATRVIVEAVYDNVQVLAQSRQDAEQRLASLGNEDGIFLLRASRGKVVLSLADGRTAHHLVVQDHGNPVAAEDFRLEDLDRFVTYYSSMSASALPTKLRRRIA